MAMKAGAKSGGKKPPLGSGGRFKALQAKIEGQGQPPEAAAAIAASAGRKKFGASKMAKMAAKGRARGK